MIKFFRKIRQNLLSERNTGEYFKYAIGEIILVVIGILIALQINNWNEAKIDAKALSNVLIEIKEDIIQDRGELKLKLEIHSEDLEAQQRVIKVLETKDRFNEDIRTDLGRLFLARTFYSVSKGYDLLKEKNLTSLKNKDLRISLTKYYEQDIPNVYREFEDDKMEFESYWLPYVRMHFKEWEFGEYGVPYEYDKILDDRNLLTATKLNCTNLRGTITVLDQALKSAINLIEQLTEEK